MIRIGGVALVLVAMGSLCIAQTPQTSVPPPRTSAPAASPPISAAIVAIETDLREGRFREAQAKAQEVLKSQPDSALAWTYLGMASVRLEQAPQAIQAYERAAALNPKDPRPYFDLALLYAAKNDLDKAVDSYQIGLSIDDRNATAYYNYGRLLITKGRYAEAVDALRRAVQINDTDTEARMALVEAHLRAKQRQEAANQVKVILEARGVNAPALVSLGGLLVRGGEPELARGVLARALELSPDSAGAYIGLSRLHLAHSDHLQAIRAARRAAKLAPTSLEANLALAEALITGHRDLQALEHLLKLQPRFGNSAAFHYTLGIAQFRVDRYQDAIASFQRAVQFDPGMDMAYFLLGNTCLTTGKLDEAETSFKAAIGRNPKIVLYYNYLARVYERKGSQFRQAALAVTNEALALDPKDVESRERLAKWAKEEGDLPRARALLEQVIAENPEVISARALLANVYYRLNLRKEGDEQQKVIRVLEAEEQKRERRLLYFP